MQVIFRIPTVSETEKIAVLLAKHAARGDIIALNGPLGAGKTVFARAFIRALTSKTTEVPSPTFTLLQTYDTPDFPVYHFDMYRLKTPEEAYEIGIEDAFFDGVSLIEWPEKIAPLLPKKRYDLTFVGTNDDRTLILNNPESDETDVWPQAADIMPDVPESDQAEKKAWESVKQNLRDIGGILPEAPQETPSPLPDKTKCPLKQKKRRQTKKQ